MSEPGRKPRILVLTSTFPRWRGDTEPRFVLDLCRHLAEFADLLILAPHAAGAARDELLEGVRVRRYRYFVPAWQGLAYEGGIVARVRANFLRALQLPFFFFALWWSASRTIRAWRPDLIHAHWVIPQALVACLVPGRRVPILCTSHGGDLHGLTSSLMRWLKAWTLRRCRRVTVVSGSLVDQVRTLAPEISVDVAPMGTDLTTRFVPPEDPRLRSESEIIFVGRLVEKKGVQYLVDAFVTLARNHPHLKLTIVGDGPYRQELMTRANRSGVDGISFIGSLGHSDLPGLYQRATVAVFPFAGQEGFGLVMVEAMGCGCTVIASDISATRETIVSGTNGLLVPPRSSEALTEAISKCLGDPDLRSRFSSSALSSVQEKFDWACVAKRYRAAIFACIK